MALFDIPVVHWLLFIAINGLLVLSSYCLAGRFLGKASFAGYFSATLASTGLIYLSLIIVVVLFFGVAVRSLDAWLMGSCSALMAIAILFTQWHYRLPFWLTLSQRWRQLRRARDLWLWVFLLLLILQILVSLVKVYIIPVHILDSLAYRAVPAPVWYQLGYIPSVLDLPANEVNGRSLSIAVLMLWYFLYLGSDQLVNLPQYVASLILVLLAYTLSRQCGLSRSGSFKVGVLIYFMPVVLMQNVSTQDHLSINVAFLASLYFLRAGFLHKTLQLIPLLGLSVGLMFAFKNNAVVYLPVLFVAGVWLFDHHRPIRPSSRAALLRLGRQVALALCLATLVGGYWTIKNIVVFNNPFGLLFTTSVSYNLHPTQTLQEMSEVQKVFLSTTKPVQEKVKTLSSTTLSAFNRAGNNFWSSINNFFPRVADVKEDMYYPLLRNMSAFGPQFFSFGLPALLLLWLSVFCGGFVNPGRFYAVVGVAMLSVYFCVTSNVYAYRNFLFFPVLLLPYVFCWLERQGTHAWTQRSKKGVQWVVLGCVLWSSYLMLLPIHSNPLIAKEFISIDNHYQSPARYIRHMGGMVNTMRRLDELPPTAGLAYISNGQRNSWSYAFYDVHWQRPVSYISLQARYFSCDKATLTCLPSPAFKERLLNEHISFVSLCFFEGCLELSDPEFVKIDMGLYYFKGQA